MIKVQESKQLQNHVAHKMIHCIYQKKTGNNWNSQKWFKRKMTYIKKKRKGVIFKTKTKMRFVSPENVAVASDKLSDTESDATIGKESDQSYNPE